MGVSQRHHYVPEMLSKRFTRDGKFWHYDSLKPELGVRLLTPRAVFWLRHHNTIRGPNGEKDVSVEVQLGQELESPASDILDEIGRIVRRGKRPALPANCRELLADFIYCQYRRTPEAIQRVVPDAERAAFDDSVMLKLEQRMGRSLSDKEFEAVNADGYRDRLIENARIKATGRADSRVRETLSRCGFFYLLPERSSFVISSNPVLKLSDPLRPTLGAGETMLVLPIAPDIAIGFGSAQREGEMTYIDGSRIRRFNLMSIRQSTAFAALSKEQALSLASPK